MLRDMNKYPYKGVWVFFFTHPSFLLGQLGTVFAQKCFSCAKSASKVIVPPKEMLLLFFD